MRQITYLLLFILSLISYSSCTDKPEKIIPIEDLKISIQKKIKLSLEENNLRELGLSKSVGEDLRIFYKKNNYTPKWVNKSSLTEKGIQLKKILSNKFQFGIPNSRYNGIKIKNTSFLQDEILLTATLGFMANDLKNGFIDKDSSKLKPLTFGELSLIEKIEIAEQDSISFELLKFGPADTNYQQLALGLFNFCSNNSIDSTKFDLNQIKNDSLKTAKKSLFSKGFLKSETIDSIEFVTSLKLFQIQNGLKPDGKIGNYTALALAENKMQKLQRIAITMEKWRWKTEYPEKYIRINVPEYLLRLYMNDSLKSLNRIIVGKIETQTPELTATIRQIVLFPYWVVPQSITNKEMLPKAKENVNYFEKNNLKIFKNETEIDPKSINWAKIKDNSFPFRVRQENGPENSLGILKFEFHNPYGVYVHDTPNKSLFNRDIRAFSHGCMRCEFPIELAKMILDADSIKKKRNLYTSTSIDSLLELKEHIKIDLRKPIPIFVEYKTVTFENSMIIFHPDIYGRDEKLIALLN
jgi:murein L,D-transpeptidase YcbB/YkuD